MRTPQRNIFNRSMTLRSKLKKCCEHVANSSIGGMHNRNQSSYQYYKTELKIVEQVGKKNCY